MVERFFSTAMNFKDPPPPSAINHDSLMLLLSGPPSSGKTSLLFQFAFNSVLLHSGGSSNAAVPVPVVVYICNRRKFETQPPFLSQGIDPSSHVFDRIQMKFKAMLEGGVHLRYVDNEEGMNKYFAAFHMYDTFPMSVIVDDFGDFFDEINIQDKHNNPRGRDMAIVRTLALCHNAMTHANKTSSCKLLLSDTHHGDSPRLLYIYKRWVSSIYTIKGNGMGSFFLESKLYSGNSSLELERMRTAKYSISLQYLVLEDISEDGEQSQC